jgi:hypothetical protein
MAYWAAAMTTYKHPFWDPPSQADETADWALVQIGLTAQKASAREKLYLAAVAALYKDAGVETKIGAPRELPRRHANRLRQIPG